jgi:hypothetical protein
MKITETKEWRFRGFCMVIGLALAVVSLVGILQGIYWVPWFSHSRGEHGIMSLGSMFLFGALITAIGIFAGDSKDDARRRKR